MVNRDNPIFITPRFADLRHDLLLEPIRLICARFVFEKGKEEKKRGRKRKK